MFPIDSFLYDRQQYIFSFFIDLNHFNPLLTVLTVLAKLPAAFLTASKIETALKTAMTERIGVTGFGI